MKYIKIEDFLLKRGETYITMPHHCVLPFGNVDDELFGNELDYCFWTFEDNECKKPKPYPTHVCKLPELPDEYKSEK